MVANQEGKPRTLCLSTADLADTVKAAPYLKNVALFFFVLLN